MEKICKNCKYKNEGIKPITQIVCDKHAVFFPDENFFCRDFEAKGKIIERIEWRNVYEDGIDRCTFRDKETALRAGSVDPYNLLGKYIKTIKTKVRVEV